MSKETKTKKIFAYEIFEGDKGIIIANTENEAHKLFKKEYPDTKIADDDNDYYDGGAFVYEVDDLNSKNRLYCVFDK